MTHSQAVSGLRQGVPDVSLSSETWLGCQLPSQAPQCSPAQGEMNSSWESWLAQACSAGQRTGRCPRPIPFFLTSHAQRSAASSDGYPVCFPFEPGLSLSLSLAPVRLLSFFFPSPITYSWNRFNSQHWCLETTRGHRSDSGWFCEWPVDNSNQAMEVKRLDVIRDAFK